MADSKIFPHSYNTLIGFDVADEQMNSMNKCDVGPPYANGLCLYTQKTSENLSSLVFSVSFLFKFMFLRRNGESEKN